MNYVPHAVPIEAGLCKLYGSEATFEIGNEAIQCMGGNGGDGHPRRRVEEKSTIKFT